MDTLIRRPGLRRALASVGAAALAVALLPTTSATADEHDVAESRGFDRVCPAAGDAAVEDPATPSDVDGTTHEPAITCALQYGLVQGFGDGTYGPDMDVTRGQMATFIANWVRTAANADFEDVDEDQFSDIDGTTHAEAINLLSGASVISGRDDGTYGPDESVTRGQMARFIAAAIDVADTRAVDGSLPPDEDTDVFDDVAGTTFESEIRAIAGVGIVQGVGDGAYAPGAAVTRGQLATFLMSAADYLGRQQRWEPTAEVVVMEVDLAGLNEVDDSGATPVFGQGQVDATGEAVLTIDAFAGEIEIDLDYSEVDGPFDGEGSPGAHIHMGAIDENGGVVVGFATGAELQAAGGTLTTTVQEDIEAFRFADLLENPDAFYVNVHNDEFPAGAVRGQLPDGGQELLEPSEFTVTMTGEAEIDDSVDPVVPGVGEIDATAEATIEIDYVSGDITYSVDVSEVTGPFDDAPGFHIHVGEADENGGIVAFLANGADVEAAAGGTLSGTFSDAPRSLLREIIANPTGYYVNLHSDNFPAGAVRAQLG